MSSRLLLFILVLPVRFRAYLEYLLKLLCEISAVSEPSLQSDFSHAHGRVYQQLFGMAQPDT